jgi:hypothetical protein
MVNVSKLVLAIVGVAVATALVVCLSGSSPNVSRNSTVKSQSAKRYRKGLVISLSRVVIVN